MDDAELRTASLSVLAATEKSAVGILSPEARAERDRLLLIALAAIAVSIAAKLPTEIKLPLFDLSLQGTSWLQWGLAITLAYYLCSFVLLTTSDWLRWSAIFGSSIQSTGDWSKRIRDDSDATAQAQNEAHAKMCARLDAYYSQRSAIQERIVFLEARQGDQLLSFHERQEVTEELHRELEALGDLTKRNDFRPDADEAWEDMVAIQSNTAFQEMASGRLSRLKRLAKLHLAISALIPSGIALFALVLLGRQIWIV